MMCTLRNVFWGMRGKSGMIEEELEQSITAEDKSR